MDPTITASGAGQPLPSVISVKHRRTRSGCLTCRARRVKVTLSESFLKAYVHYILGSTHSNGCSSDSVTSNIPSAKVCFS